MTVNKKTETGRIDWMITLLPLALVVALSGLFFFLPEQSNAVIGQIRFLLGDTLGSVYLVVGLGMFLISIYIACSKYGDIVLGGREEKPQYSFFAWGSMMFTAGLAADILFYSFSEWILYATDPHIAAMGGIQQWAGVYPLFHWSLIPWSFYLVLAVAFGFMLHVRKGERQRYSEACRPILGKHTDGLVGRIIDLLAVFALLAGTATTFSLATPLMAGIIDTLVPVPLNRTAVTIVILIVTCAVYTYSLLHGIRGISVLANLCVYLFFGLLAYVLFFGGEGQYIIETGIESLGTMAQNFLTLATHTDPLRESSFPQNWTIFYWAYWMVWCVAAPFFIGTISRGRTVRQTQNGLPDRPPDRSGGLRLRRGLHHCQLRGAGQPFHGQAADGPGGFHRRLSGKRGPVQPDHLHDRDNSPGSAGAGGGACDHDGLLCHLFRLHRPHRRLLQLPPPGPGGSAPQADPADVVRAADPAAHRADLLRQLHEQPPVRQHHRRIPHRRGHRPHHRQFSEGREKLYA